MVLRRLIHGSEREII